MTSNSSSTNGTRLVVVMLALIAGLAVGCTPAEAPQASVPSDGIELLPPAQVQRALEQLSATDARTQKSGLEFAERFPSLADTHRKLIENLAEYGATSSIKEKASQLLDPNE